MHKDAAGKPIKVGDYFTYATKIADRSHLQFGRVVELTGGEPVYPEEGITTRAKIKAITVQRHWSTGTWVACKGGAAITIERLDATLVVPKSSLDRTVYETIADAFDAARELARRKANKAAAKAASKPRTRADNASGPDSYYVRPGSES